MVLVGLLAKKRHGKDTVADYLVENHGFTKMSFAKPMKEASRILFGFNDEQLYGDLKEVEDPFWKTTPRIVLQWLGTDVFREQVANICPDVGKDFWVQVLMNNYNKAIAKDPNFKCVIADVRFPNEVVAVQKAGGVVIKIERAGIVSHDEHPSEAGIDMINNYNTLIQNNGTLKDLYGKVENMFGGVVQA